MNKIFRALFTLIFVYSLTSTLFAEEGSSLQIRKEPWDFGKIVKGAIKEKTFSVKNKGDKPLEIEQIKACCGYTVVDVDKWILNPGESSKIRISSDTSRKAIGIDGKYITVFSNDKNTSVKKVSVKTEIIRDKRQEKINVFSINVDQLNDFIQGDKVVLIMDVREQSEYSEKHIPGAINYPRSKMKNIDKVLTEAVSGIDKSTVISVNCGGGIRSSYIARKLKDMGYNAFNLEGGMMAWQKAGYDIVTGPKAPPSIMPLEIGLEEAYEHYFLLFKDKALWVDLRDSDAFKKGHVEGAINVEMFDLKEALSGFPRNKEIIIYCYGPGCGEAGEAGKMLIENGFSQGKTKVMGEGYQHWEVAGYPVER